MLKKHKNIEYMDIAKAIGIILMVIGHSGSPFSKIIYLFHMPLFFFISGYFYNEKYTYNIKQLTVKRIKSLYLPFIKYQLVFLALHNVFYNMNLYSYEFDGVSRLYTISDYIKNTVNILTFGGTEEFGSAFWFLVSLFTVNVLFAIIRYFSFSLFKNKGEYASALIILICFIVGSKISLPRYIDTSLVALFIFYIGFLYNKYEDNIKMKSSYALLSLLVLVVNSSYGEVSMGYNSYHSLIFLIISSLSGIYFTIYISKLLVPINFSKNLLKYIGRNTIIIVGLHFLAFKIVSLLLLNIYSLQDYMLASFPIINMGGYWWILYSLIGLFIPILIKYSLDKVVKNNKLKKQTNIL